MGWWSSIWKKRAETWTVESLDANQVPDKIAHEPIAAEQTYIRIFLRSMRIVNVRNGLSKFYGTVHSYTAVPHLSGTKAEFNVLTTPSKLKDIDAKSVDRVISLNQPLLGPIPYRGGDVEIEVGLFSIKSADLAGPYLSVLEKMSNVAGVSYFSLALPFVEPLKEGVNLLVGAQQDSTLEIGLAQTFSKPETGYFVVIGAPKGTFKVSDLVVQKDYQLADQKGKALVDYPYMVICVEASARREDWYLIPELAAAYKDLQAQVKTGKLDRVEESFSVFRRMTLTSPDLLDNDADKIVSQIETRIKNALGPTRTSAAKKPTLPALKTVRIY